MTKTNNLRTVIFLLATVVIAAPALASRCRGSSDATAQAPVAGGAQISEKMMQQCGIMMQTKIFLDSPAAILGQTQTLGLSEEQNRKLLEIEKQAREKALAVLTPEQRQKLGDVSAQPVSMASLCQNMCEKMMAGAGKDMPGQTMCPMMQRMTQSKDKQTRTPQQTVCPVMGGKINKDVFTEYKGKKVYFCCPGCIAKFKKNPEKYIAKLPQFKQAEPAKKVEEAPAGTEQKVCPLMGGAINKATN